MSLFASLFIINFQENAGYISLTTYNIYIFTFFVKIVWKNNVKKKQRSVKKLNI